MAHKILTAERLRELLHYDPETGFFTWLVDRRGHRGIKAGDRAGGINSQGYVQIGIDGKHYRGQRLAWLYVHGTWPPHGVDHEDMTPTNNAFKNLRSATQGQNMQNQCLPRSDNKTGVLGVSYCNTRGMFRATVTLNEKMVYSKYFDTLNEAKTARLEAKRRFHPFAVIPD